MNIVGQTNKVKINGYVLKFEEDMDLREHDAVLVSYTEPFV